MDHLTPALRPRPDELGASGFVLVLGFDGVINRLRRGPSWGGRRGRFVDSQGRRVRVDWNDDRVRQLDEIVTKYDAELAWLTSRGADVGRAVELLGGALRGGYLLEEPPVAHDDGSVRPGWKTDVIADRIAGVLAVPWIWIDDSEPAIAKARRPGLLDLEVGGTGCGMTLQPRPAKGVSLQDVVDVDRYFRQFVPLG